MDTPVCDKIGQQITEGCFIAYGHALGRCAGLRIGKVIKVVVRSVIGYHSREELVYRITVHGVDDDWSHQPARLCRKKGTLLFPNRILVLTDNLVPQTIKDLYLTQCQ